jgi:hypothetical protein
MLIVMDEWADRGIAPPPSRYPDVRNNSLVLLADAAKAFPSLPGVRFPTVLNELKLLDYGPSFRSTGGKLTKLPPAAGASYQVRVPKPNRDGIDEGGILTPDIAAPVGTNLAWNFLALDSRSADLCGLSGSFIPLAKTRADRSRNGDPRPSLEERYTDHAGFVKAVERSARDLVKQRFLLEEDARTMTAEAEKSDILR